jgi:hypothetical protein
MKAEDGLRRGIEVDAFVESMLGGRNSESTLVALVTEGFSEEESSAEEARR